MKIKPVNWWQDMPERYEETTLPVLTVYPSEPTQTGILDENGNPIMRNPERMGFLKDEIKAG